MGVLSSGGATLLVRLAHPHLILHILAVLHLLAHLAHALASAAGAQILEQGGNAVDAVIAAALAAGVVQPAGSGLGGGGFAVVVDEQGHSFSLDFREIAPAKAHRDLFVQNDDIYLSAKFHDNL